MWDVGFVDLETLAYYSQLIHIMINYENKVWLFIVIYGCLIVAEKKQLWSSLCSASGMHDLPWILIGDFNQFLFLNERTKWGIINFNNCNQMRECMNHCQLIDLGTSGLKFTWWKKIDRLNFTRERLDRAVANEAWRTIFPHA